MISSEELAAHTHCPLCGHALTEPTPPLPLEGYDEEPEPYTDDE